MCEIGGDNLGGNVDRGRVPETGRVLRWEEEDLTKETEKEALEWKEESKRHGVQRNMFRENEASSSPRTWSSVVTELREGVREERTCASGGWGEKGR